MISNVETTDKIEIDQHLQVVTVPAQIKLKSK